MYMLSIPLIYYTFCKSFDKNCICIRFNPTLNGLIKIIKYCSEYPHNLGTVGFLVHLNNSALYNSIT